MANLNDYIHEEILYEEVKLNKMSNSVGKIILKAYNIVSKLEDGEKYDSTIEMLKQMRVEMLILENKIYSGEADDKKIKSHVSGYVKALKKAKEEFSSIENKTKLGYLNEKIDKTIEKMKKIKVLL